MLVRGWENPDGEGIDLTAQVPQQSRPARRDTGRRKTRPRSRLGGEARVTLRPQPDDRWTGGGTGHLSLSPLRAD